MKPHQTELKEKLSNFAHFRILEIFGLSAGPISSTQVERQFRYKNSYCYTIVKDLAKNGFLKISYKDKIEVSKKELPRNHRYNLNLKGLLLYLLAAHRNDRIRPKTVNKIIKLFLETNPQFDFFEDLNAFEVLDEKVNLLVNVALELQNQLKDLTTEYLANYMIRRFYTEIAEYEAWSSIQDSPSWKLASRYIKKGDKSYFMTPSNAQIEEEKRNKVKTLRFWKSKQKILDKLITVMEKDLVAAKRQRQFELEFPRSLED